MTVEITDYNEIEIPDFGDKWYEPFINNWETIDKLLIKSELKTNLPSAGTKDRLFLAKDENQLYRDDGNKWNPKLPQSTEVTKSGDGSQKVFQLNHNLDVKPSNADVTPKSADASGDYYISDITDTYIEVTYINAPASATDNVVLTVTTYP